MRPQHTLVVYGFVGFWIQLVLDCSVFPTVIEADQKDPAARILLFGADVVLQPIQNKTKTSCFVVFLISKVCIIVNMINLDIIKDGFDHDKHNDKDKDNMVNNYQGLFLLF